MSSVARKIDSNFTGLRFAEEAPGCIGVLPGEIDPATLTPFAGLPVWKPLEPNSYGDFGPQISTVARTPIRPGRQREKGVTTDLDAVANFQVDFTQDNLYELLQGFFFADWRDEAATQSVAADIEITATDTISGTGIDAEFAVGDLVQVRGFNNTANNDTFIVTGEAADEITIENLDGTVGALVVEPTSTSVSVKRIGVEGTAGDINVDATSGSFPALTSTTLDFSTIGLVNGQWVYIGGDAVGSGFTGANNNGFVRIRSVAANRLEFDKTQNPFSDETAVAVALQIFIGDLIRNEEDPANIITRSYSFERSLSTAGYEYVEGCVANTLTLNFTTADKITADLGYIGTDGYSLATRYTVGAADARNATPLEIDGASGQYPGIETSATAFNTTSDFSRIRTAQTGVASTPLFAFITDLTLNVSNNVTPAKAIGTLGAFDVTIGDFVAEGSITAYFADVAAQQAIRDNDDVTVDFFLAKGNAGWVFDVPLLTLGEGRLNVTKDEPITIPVSIGGARDPYLNTTLQAAYFPYLPDAAEG